MPVIIPRGLVEHVLLGPAGDRRQLQDSPILGDVWIEFAKNPGSPQELLITPHKAHSAGHVADALDEQILADRVSHRRKNALANIAYLQGVVAANLYFDEVLRVIVPLTEWWGGSRNQKDIAGYLTEIAGTKKLDDTLEVVLKIVEQWSNPDSSQKNSFQGVLSALDRYAAIAGIILWAGQEGKGPAKKLTDKALAAKIKKGKAAIAKGLTRIFNEILTGAPEKKTPSLVYQISLNRKVKMAVARSVPAVKADAARTLFKVDCSQIAWAVIDAGIQGAHPAFRTGPKPTDTRVKASFDFSKFRRIVSLDNLRIFRQSAGEKAKTERLKDLLDKTNLKNRPSKEAAIELLTNLANDIKFKRPIHWEFVEPFIEIKTDTRPAASDHGTHVAGIIGADKDGDPSLSADEASNTPTACAPIFSFTTSGCWPTPTPIT